MIWTKREKDGVSCVLGTALGVPQEVIVFSVSVPYNKSFIDSFA